MASFVGFVNLEDTLIAPVLVRDNQLQAVLTDSPPTFRVYGAGVYMGVAGAAVALDTTGLYVYSVPALATAGFVAGQTYFVLISGTVGGVPFAALQTFGVT